MTDCLTGFHPFSRKKKDRTKLLVIGLLAERHCADWTPSTESTSHATKHHDHFISATEASTAHAPLGAEEIVFNSALTCLTVAVAAPPVRASLFPFNYGANGTSSLPPARPCHGTRMFSFPFHSSFFLALLHLGPPFVLRASRTWMSSSFTTLFHGTVVCGTMPSTLFCEQVRPMNNSDFEQNHNSSSQHKLEQTRATDKQLEQYGSRKMVVIFSNILDNLFPSKKKECQSRRSSNCAAHVFCAKKHTRDPARCHNKVPRKPVHRPFSRVSPMLHRQTDSHLAFQILRASTSSETFPDISDH